MISKVISNLKFKLYNTRYNTFNENRETGKSPKMNLKDKFESNEDIN